MPGDTSWSITWDNAKLEEGYFHDDSQYLKMGVSGVYWITSNVTVQSPRHITLSMSFNFDKLKPTNVDKPINMLAQTTATTRDGTACSLSIHDYCIYSAHAIAILQANDKLEVRITPTNTTQTDVQNLQVLRDRNKSFLRVLRVATIPAQTSSGAACTIST